MKRTATPWRRIGPLGMLCIALAGCQNATTRPVPPLPVEASPVQVGALSLTVRTLGQAVAVHSVTIIPQVTGILERVAVHSGEQVRQGQLLFQIDPNMAATQVAQDRANLQGAIAQMRYDQAQVKAYAPLIRKDYVTLQTYQQTQAQAQTAAASVAADRAILHDAELNLAYTTISAPVSGRIGLLTLKSGNLVTANSTVLTTLNQIRPMEVQFSLPEKDLPALRQALHSGRKSVAVWDENHRVLLGDGPVMAVNNTVNNASATVTARALLPNANGALWPGEFLQVTFTRKWLPRTLRIPANALQQGESGPFVYVVRQGKAMMQPVTFLGEDHGLVAISGQIAVGALVIDGAPTRLHPGSAVQIIRAAGAPVNDGKPA